MHSERLYSSADLFHSINKAFACVLRGLFNLFYTLLNLIDYVKILCVTNFLTADNARCLFWSFLKEIVAVLEFYTLAS